MSWLQDSLWDFWRRGDKLLLSLCLLASGYGLILIYSATRWNTNNRSVVVQALGIFLGVLVYIALSSVDMERFVEKWWKWVLVFDVGFNLLVRVPGLGVQHGGNLSWIRIPGIPLEIQPAEVVKLTFILLFAFQCTRPSGRDLSSIPSVAQLVAHLGLTAGVIAWATRDFGMMLVYLFLFVLMTWAAGVKLRWFALGAGSCTGVVALVWPHISDQYFAKRIMVVIDHITGNPDTIYEQTQVAGWQQTRSILAIGSGGLTGQGYLKGIQTQSHYESSLNARHTDEIFAVCGEELGMIGCILIILILCAIIARCIWVARHAPSPTSRLMAMGFGGMLLFQSVLNIGMCLYVLPIVGLTLPFFSYGGTSIITMFAAMGMVSSIKTHSLPSWLRDRTR